MYMNRYTTMYMNRYTTMYMNRYTTMYMNRYTTMYFFQEVDDEIKAFKALMSEFGDAATEGAKMSVHIFVQVACQ